jgi:protein-disulfide isomerase
MEIIEKPSLNTRWHHKWWGVAIIIFASLIVVVLVIFATITAIYWWQIKHGQSASLAKKFNGFGGGNSLNTGLSSKRQILEATESPFFGNASSSIVIVEFVDYKCSNCLAVHSTIRSLLSKYGNKIKFIVRQFPIESLHSGTGQLSQLVLCANKQGNFWGMHDVLFANQTMIPAQLTDNEIKNLSLSARVDYTKLSQCLKNGETAVAVNKDYADGYQYGILGTPTFFVNGNKLEGVVDFESWVKIIEAIK